MFNIRPKKDSAKNILKEFLGHILLLSVNKDHKEISEIFLFFETNITFFLRTRTLSIQINSTHKPDIFLVKLDFTKYSLLKFVTKIIKIDATL